MKNRTAFALLPFLLATPCGAANQDEIQVYDDSISKPGEFGLEVHLNTTPEGRSFIDYPGEITNDHGFRYTYMNFLLESRRRSRPASTRTRKPTAAARSTLWAKRFA